MTSNIPLSYKGKTGKKTVIEHVEYNIDELPDSDPPKAAVRVFDKIYNGKAGVLTSSICFDFIETLWGSFHSEDLVVHLNKLYPNESVSMDQFYFLRWYVDD